MSGEVELVRADLLASLESSGWLSSTALEIDRELPFDKFEALGVLLGKVGTAVRFWIGDFLLYGERLYGEAGAQASEALNLSPEGRQDCLRVALAFPPAKRSRHLSFGHHRTLAARWLEPFQRYELLDRAEREAWTVRELEAHVRSLRRGDSDSRYVTADCDAALEELLSKARQQLLACGYDRDLILELRVRGRGVEYVVEQGPPADHRRRREAA